LLSRLQVFSLTSGLLFFVLALYAVLRSDGIAARLKALPGSLRAPFVGLWLAATFYRVFLNRVDNSRLHGTALNDRLLIGYSWRLIGSTLISTLFSLCAVLYLSGVLDPAARTIVGYWRNLDQSTVNAVLSVAASILWGVVANAIWALVKHVGRRMVPPASTGDD